MAPNPVTPDGTPAAPEVVKTSITRTVFDLARFEDVQLSKEIELPAAPADLEAALVAVGNDSAKLLKVIHAGLCAEAKDAAYDQIDGFSEVTEDADGNEISVPYTGKFASGEVTKKVNAAVLSIAKMLGFDKGLSKEQKRAKKEEARTFLRSNPAMLANLQNQ